MTLTNIPFFLTAGVPGTHATLAALVARDDGTTEYVITSGAKNTAEDAIAVLLEAEAYPDPADLARATARAHLAETDWYAHRKAETGKPIPENIQNSRVAARELLS